MPQNNARKRKAIELVAQLPDDIEDALAVLEYAKELVRDYLSDKPPSLELVSGGEILDFSAATASANSR